MTADRLRSRLHRAKQTGPGRWLASCPAHDDRRASLSIRELDDGTVLIRCFVEYAAADAQTGETIVTWVHDYVIDDVDVTQVAFARLPAWRSA